MNSREAARLARILMNENGLESWSFYFDNAKRRFGSCNYSKFEITLSVHLVELNPVERVEKTIRHEIAHAKAGYKAGHGPVWRAWCSRLGIPADRCYSDQDTATVTAPFVGTCPNCNHKTYRFKRTRTACKRCCNKHNGGKYSVRYCFRWSRNDGLQYKEPVAPRMKTSLSTTKRDLSKGGLDRFR